MDWIITLSERERESRTLSPETAQAVFRALHIDGAALLRGAFAKNNIEGLYKEFLAQFGTLGAADMEACVKSQSLHPFMKVGSKRFDVAPRMVGALADPTVFADPMLLNILYQRLGFDMRLGAFTVVASFPGAPAKPYHRDHPHLYPEGDLGSVLPTHAINAAVPLMDVDIEMGPTGLWLGSHRWPEGREPDPNAITIAPFSRGDVVLLDYRTLHSGVPNQTNQMRPILYMTYSRTWFFDETNYKARKSVDMPLETLLALPEATRNLLLRVYSQSMRSKQATDIVETAPSEGVG
jgi:hypothetical protein